MFASLPWAARKAARPRLLTWVPSGRENLLKIRKLLVCHTDYADFDFNELSSFKEICAICVICGWYLTI